MSGDKMIDPWDLYCPSCGMPIIEATAHINALQAERDLLRAQLEVAKEALKTIRPVTARSDVNKIIDDTLAEIAKLGEKK